MQSPVPLLARQLTALKGVLAKGQAFAAARKVDEAVMLGLRLAPDMLPLWRQVTIACDAARGAAHRLAGREVPSVPDTETTFAELMARIDATQAMIAAIPEAEFEGAEARTVTMRVRGADMTLPGTAFLEGFALTNFFFHATMTYALLRANGVELGKRDFLGA